MTDSDVPEKTKNGLIRKLGFFDSTMIMVGIVIGSGIFLTTGLMAKTIPSPGYILLAWIVGGFITLAGALTYAELGAMMPKAGGQYVYLKEAYGPLWGFLFGWLTFMVYVTGGIAALAVAFAEYFGYFFPALSTKTYLFSLELNVFGKPFAYSLSVGQLLAVCLILLLSFVNYIGMVFGKIIQNFFTIVKIGAIMVFIVLGFSIGKGIPVDLSLNSGGIGIGQLISGFGIALIGVFWAFDGWNNINFVAGEIKNPQKNIPLTLIIGTLTVTFFYILVNYIYLYALSISQMKGVERIAEKATSALFGGPAADLISIAVIISILGSINGSIMTGPRVYYAMAKDQLFFKSVARVSPRYRTPGFSIFAQAVWASFLTLSGTFEQIITFAIFISIIFWIAATAAVFSLRKKFPDMPRPYKTWGYPFIPIIFIIASVGILINTLLEKPIESLAGVIFILIGIPVYYFWKKRKHA